MMTNVKEMPRIDIEALPDQDVAIDQHILERDISSIHGTGWDELRNAPDPNDPLISALIQWLGRDRVMEMSAVECDHLRHSVGRLPEPVSQTSFAWDAIKQPGDIRRVSQAVVVYRNFNPAAVAISEAMGNNEDVRRIIVSQADHPEQQFSDYVASKQRELLHVTRLKDRIDALKGPLTNLFGKDEVSIEAAVVVIAASQGIARSFQHMRSGLALPTAVVDEHLEALDLMRRQIVVAADRVYRIADINPMQYSLSVLSGVRRSIGPDATGDYYAAIEGLGGVIGNDEDLIDQSRSAFELFFEQNAAFNLLITQLGLTVDDVPALLANVLLRRHLVTAAKSAGIAWEDVREDLSLVAKASFEELQAFVEIANQPGMTGHLRAVSKNRMARPISQVAKAARNHIVTQEYWLGAAERVIQVQDDLRFVDLREVLRMEPEIDNARQLLKDCGAHTAADVDELQAHLEWMISAFALPISDDAVEAIISTKAEVIPMRLCKAR